MPTHRVEKVSAQLMREISQLINTDFSENYGLITVGDIYVTSDFKDAKVYISVLDEKKEKEILEKICKKSSQYQHSLGRKLKMRSTPRLNFSIDNSRDKINHIDKLLREVNHGA